MGNNRSLKGLFLFLGVFVFYRLSLDYIYTNIISPVFEYQHFIVSYNLIKYSLLLIWFIVIALYDYKLYRDSRPSSTLLFFIDIFFFVPLTSIAGLANFNTGFIVYGFIFWIMMAVFQLKQISRNNQTTHSKEGAQISNVFFTISWIVVVVNFLITIYYNGFHIKIDLDDVYDLRAAMGEIEMPGLVGYIKPWASKLTILLLLLYIERKKFVSVGILSIIQLSSFAFGGMKGDAFTLLVAFVVGFLYTERHKKYILYGMAVLNILVLVEFWANGISTISILIHRRMLYMPSLLSSEYYTFFTANEFVYLRGSFLRWFGFANPYQMDIPYLIGSEVYGAPEMGANTGILGDDYAQFGWLSLLIYPFLRIKVLHWGLDNMMRYMSDKFILLISFMFAFSFISGSFFSILLTGGYIITVLILSTMKDRRNKVIKNVKQSIAAK